MTIIGLAPAAAQDQNQPASTVKATHGSWEVRCGVENPDRCVMVQTGNNENGEPVLQAILSKAPGLEGPNGEEIAALMEIVAPIGVLLPAGVAVKIDGREVGRGGYRYCNPQACLVTEPIQDDFVNQLKRGSNAVFTLTALNGQTADITISLSGFTKAFNAM
ncbi:MAG: invasion associated locus B family protein [Pseudomonadota bacterium]